MKRLYYMFIRVVASKLMDVCDKIGWTEGVCRSAMMYFRASYKLSKLLRG